VYRLVPKVGPFRSLSFSVRAPEGERLFLESFTLTRERFRESLNALRAAQLRLPNTDFDTGPRPTGRGEYAPADAMYDELLNKLALRAFVEVPAGLAANIVSYYGAADSLPGDTADQRKRSTKIRGPTRRAQGDVFVSVNGSSGRWASRSASDSVSTPRSIPIVAFEWIDRPPASGDDRLRCAVRHRQAVRSRVSSNA
jgi:hypothetical protein